MGPESEQAKLVVKMLSQIMRDGARLKACVSSLNKDVFQIVRYPGHAGKKGFTAKVEFHPENPGNYSSRTKPYGFGFLGRGINSICRKHKNGYRLFFREPLSFSFA